MLRTSVGQLLVNNALPEDMRDHTRVLDKKGTADLLRQLAQKHPEKYPEVAKKLSDIGRSVATDFGGYSFGLEHLAKSQAGKKYEGYLRGKLKEILDDDDLTSEQRNSRIVQTVAKVQQKQIDEIYDEAVKGKNPIAMQVLSGSRGNKMNLGSLLGSDMLYTDHRDEVIPLAVLSSYSQGLKPIEYWAATYGARRGTMATKFATQDAGFLSKQLNQVAHRLMVVDEDDEDGAPDRGLPVDTDDGDNEGALLARDVGDYKRNTVLTPKILRHIKGQGHDRILVRSPLVGGSFDGGVYARDVGVRERGVIPGRGEMVGLTAAQALSEPLSQGQLSAKHSGGVAGQEKAVGGFAYINQLIQVPKKFKGGATHSEYDGQVGDVEKAPAGGHFVWIDGQRHYVPQGVDLTVKKGDTVEAGDVISEGFPNPAIITEHKGVGEGKRYFVQAMRQAMKDADMKVNRRNIEILARGLINHVRLTDEYGDHVPDDVLPYSTIEHQYQPRPDSQDLRVADAGGQYLERPVLHYSIGTKVRPSVVKELQHFGINEVAVHRDPPPFKPNMIRGMYSLQNDPDPITRMYGSGLKDSLEDSTARGGVSDEHGTSFVPGLARAVDFGRVGKVRAPEPGTAPPPEGQPFPDLKPKAPAAPTTSIMPTPAEPKKQGVFGSLFKRSMDKEAGIKPIGQSVQQKGLKTAKPVASRAAQIAQIRLGKTAAAPQVDSTLKPNTGSSSAAPATATDVVGQPGTGPAAAPEVPKPAAPAVPGNTALLNDKAQVPSPIQPPAPASPPAPPGQVHPDRLPAGLMPENPWASGVGTPTPMGSGQNPNAFGEGYVPGAGMMSPNDDPDQLANFVSGGNPDAPDQGFGGQFGAATRFGSLLDTEAVNTLTSGRAYTNNQPGQGAHRDDLLGGDRRTLYLPGQTNMGGASPAQQPAADKLQPLPPQPAAPATTGMQNPNYVRDTIVKTQGWQAGHPTFDAMKKEKPDLPDAEIHKQLTDDLRRTYLYKQMGYAAGKDKFEGVRTQLKQQTGGEVTDDQVMAHVARTVPVEGSVSDMDLMKESRGDPSTLMRAALISPVTSPAVFKGANIVGRNVPVLNKVPGFRPPTPAVPGAAPAAKLTAKTALKGMAKKLPFVGAAIETYDAVTTPADEIRAKYNEKMDPNKPLTAQNLGEYFADNAINPGQNLRAGLGVIPREAYDIHKATERQDLVGDAGQVAHLRAQVKELGSGRTLQPAEQKALADAQAALSGLQAKHQDNPDFRRMTEQRSDSARGNFLRAKLQLGESSVDKVMGGQANPQEQEAFEAYLSSISDPVGQPAANVSSMLDGQKQVADFYASEHARADANVGTLTGLAAKATQQGRKDVADRIAATIQKIGKNKQERDARVPQLDFTRPLADQLPPLPQRQPTPATIDLTQFARPTQPAVDY